MHALRWLAGGICVGVAIAGVGLGLTTACIVAVAGALLTVGGLPLGEASLGVAIGLIAVHSLGQGPELHGHVSIEGIVVGAPAGGSADVSVSRWTHPGEAWRHTSGRIRLRTREALRPGQPLLAYGWATPLQPATVPGAPDPAAGAKRAGIRTQLHAKSLSGFTPAEGRVLPGVHGGVLTALATGDRSQVSEPTWTTLRRTGTAHLLAISGFHVGLVGGLATGFASLLLRAVALWRPVGVPRGAAIAAGVVTALFYAHLAGLPISAQRAAGLLVLVGFAKATGRVLDPLSAWLCCAAGVLLIDPAALNSAGFQLSFGAVLGLIRVGPALERLIPLDLPKPVDWTLRSIGISTAATAGTLPAAALWFQDVAVVSPLTNLLAMPAVGAVIAPCALLGAALPELLGAVPLWIADHGFALVLAVLTPLAVEPAHPAVGPTGAVFLAIAVCWPRELGLVAACLTGAFGLEFVPRDATVTFLDIGQGDAAVVHHVDGSHWLIDGGPPGPALLSWLRREGIDHLAVVAVSHGHADHIGALPDVLRSIRVDALWVPSQGEGLHDLVNLARVRDIAVVEDPPGTWTCATGDINERSLVLGAAGVLFTGDIGVEGEACLADALPEFPVIKVAHHGSAGSSTSAFLAAVRPSVAVISAGRGNLFHHPRDVALARLQREGAQVLRTDVLGTVELSVTPTHVRVRSYRGGWSTPRGLARRRPRALARHAFAHVH